jgi:hypothetical protein
MSRNPSGGVPVGSGVMGTHAEGALLSVGVPAHGLTVGRVHPRLGVTR